MRGMLARSQTRPAWLVRQMEPEGATPRDARIAHIGRPRTWIATPPRERFVAFAASMREKISEPVERRYDWTIGWCLNHPCCSRCGIRANIGTNATAPARATPDARRGQTLFA